MIPPNFVNAVNVVIQAAALASQPPAPAPSTLLAAAPPLAASLKASFPNPNLALYPLPFWWWQSGTAVDALLTYTEVTGDRQYEPLLETTILSQATPNNDFLTIDATGNDDQTWWALAAATAAEVKFPESQGSVPWVDLARNVFEQQKERWGNEKKGAAGCKGGLGWKIAKGDGNDGFFYKNSISNGLMFQLAARLAKLSSTSNETAAKEASEWAEKVYDWSLHVGLVNDQFDVFDGTDEKNGCADLNHNQWSYNVGVYMYGSAVMAVQTGDDKWVQRTRGFIRSANRTFVNHETGALWEEKCEGKKGDEACNSDQVSFKGLLARWLGATAEILPEVSLDAKAIVSRAATAVLDGKLEGLGPIDSFNAMEVVIASLKTQGVKGEGGMIGLRRARRARRGSVGALDGNL
jgi:mannan endo-1,6-alpha-mannosidase